jgi:hypothetical protein
MKIAGSGSISQRHGSADPDPHQNVMDPEHWPVVLVIDERERRKRGAGQGGQIFVRKNENS